VVSHSFLEKKDEKRRKTSACEGDTLICVGRSIYCPPPVW
jgi:hypothetical protein